MSIHDKPSPLIHWVFQCWADLFFWKNKLQFRLNSIKASTVDFVCKNTSVWKGAVKEQGFSSNGDSSFIHRMVEQIVSRCSTCILLAALDKTPVMIRHQVSKPEAIRCTHLGTILNHSRSFTTQLYTYLKRHQPNPLDWPVGFSESACLWAQTTESGFSL